VPDLRARLGRAPPHLGVLRLPLPGVAAVKLSAGRQHALERFREVDEWFKDLWKLRKRAPLYDGAGARRAKAQRQAEAEEWIRAVRARRLP
jgi:hypothetical protein